MASPPSPTSSSRSSVFSSSFAAAPSSRFSSLPVAALREKIVEKIVENRVTLIVGETGCGKSSQVPQYLLDADLKPILCTQPRRFAVVAVAKTVAKARKCEIGGEVGYHIGHLKNLSESSKLVFKTAGVLVEEMRDKGSNALDYKVIILDEVHERSVESDLVLVCVKQYMMKNKALRLVLMSATADIARYRDYFKDLGRDERVEVLGIPSSNQKTVFDRKVFYLEQVTETLGLSSDLSSYCSGLTPSVANADIKPEVHKLIHQLVQHIHENEPDIEKSILIFLPTYNSLEQQWYLLKQLSSSFKVHILHGSVDTEKALMAMKIWKSHRKVILATNIAESSVTIPKAGFVIDSCRSLQVFWDNNRKKESAKLVWVSKSQAEQRKGRTGRTCDGQIYRLVTGSFFSKLEDYELPAILRLSLRQQVLQICCSESKAINDPKVLLQRTLDPPDREVVDDALNLLIRMHALEKISPRGRYEPTFFGRLLVSFSLSFDSSVLILKFGAAGMLREGIILGVLMDTQPLPILRPFGDELGIDYTDRYYREDLSNTSLKGRKEISFMGNLCAFRFWQRAFKDKQRVEHLRQLLVSDESKVSFFPLHKVEEEWCSFHELVQSSLSTVSDIYEDVLNSIHRYRPKFLGKSDGLPLCYHSYKFEHTCLLQCQPAGDSDALNVDDDHSNPPDEAKKCLAVPFVGSNDFEKHVVANQFAAIIKEMKSQFTEEVFGYQYENDFSPANDEIEIPICVYFLYGSCNRGNQCPFSHSLQAKRPACKFFFSLKGCRNGESGSFSHDTGPPVQPSSPDLCLQEDDHADTASLLGLLPECSDGHILVLDDADLRFTSGLASYFDPSKIIATTPLLATSIFEPSLKGVKIIWGLSHPYQTIISNGGVKSIPWKEIKCVLWFPNFESNEELAETHKMLLRNFFEYLDIRMLADSLEDLPVVLTMNNIRFSQLEVEKLGRESFFFLTESFPFAERSFGKLRDTITTKKPMVVPRPVSYVFNLHPPSKVQFGDSSAGLEQALREIQKRDREAKSVGDVTWSMN